MAEWGWVATGYVITLLTLLGYVSSLWIRARRARARTGGAREGR